MSYWNRVGFESKMTGALIRTMEFRHSDRDTGRRPHDDRSRDGSDAAASKDWWHPPEARVRQGRIPPESTLILNFREKMNLFCLKPSSWWYLVMATLGNYHSHCAANPSEKSKRQGLGGQRWSQEKLTCNVVTKSNGC